MNNPQLRQFTVLGTIVATIIFTVLANTGLFNGQTTSEVTSKYPTFFTPADYAFSIWSIIYLGLLAFGIYQVLPSQQQHPRWRRLDYWVVLNCAATCAWLLLWSYDLITLSVAAMLLMLLSLIAIHNVLEIGKTQVSSAETWLARVPFSIYLGWITVTTIANVAVAFSKLKWSGWGISPEVWAVLLTLASLGIVAMICLGFADTAYTLGIVWAYVGIAVKYVNVPTVFRSSMLAALLAISLLLMGIWGQKHRSQKLDPTVTH